MERFFFFLLFLIVEKFHHLHKAMGGGSTSPWHNQHNNPTLTLTTPKEVNGNGGYLGARCVQQHNEPPTCHLQGDVDGGSTSPKHM